MAYAHVKNAHGAYIAPAIESVTAAAAEIAKGLPKDSDFRLSIVNAPGKDAYPISSMTWLLVYARQANVDKGRKLVDFLTWMLNDGQQSAPALDFAPLPPAITRQLKDRLKQIKIG